MGAYDEIAATFLGCGNLNPVALPTFPTGITWGDTYATKGPTYYTVAGTMQEISSSYGTQNSTSKASSLAEGGGLGRRVLRTVAARDLLHGARHGVVGGALGRVGIAPGDTCGEGGQRHGVQVPAAEEGGRDFVVGAH